MLMGNASGPGPGGGDAASQFNGVLRALFMIRNSHKSQTAELILYFITTGDPKNI